MGFYYEQGPPAGRPEQPGCLDALVITRVVFQVLFWPVAALLGVVLFLGLAFYLFTIHPALALIPVGGGALLVAAFARWERSRGHGDLP